MSAGSSDDLHWHFAAEGSESQVVQLFRGKRVVGELVVTPTDVTYVQGMRGEEDEYVFDPDQRHGVTPP